MDATEETTAIDFPRAKCPRCNLLLVGLVVRSFKEAGPDGKTKERAFVEAAPVAYCFRCGERIEDD